MKPEDLEYLRGRDLRDLTTFELEKLERVVELQVRALNAELTGLDVQISAMQVHRDDKAAELRVAEQLLGDVSSLRRR
ncbi:hypothetical protein ACFRAQ_34750 [Nocardia sp. NPDC056611]|uniref:hypothetical protein n=1 Tax=Nocardia sp. NPDC056611 TaxID=3345877 RepID=UPI00366B0C67